MARTPPRYLSIPAPGKPDRGGEGGGKEFRQKYTASATVPHDHLVFPRFIHLYIFIH